MSSSRSIAAARARRSGEQAPPVSGNRPVTSINSHAAFAPQQMPNQYQQYQNMPSVPSNVRLSKSQQQSQQTQPIQNPSMHPNGLPFAKLSMSDAIGLITLRLGRVEQFMIDLENNNEFSMQTDGVNIPENSKLIDNSVLTSMMNRLDSLEKKDSTVLSNDIYQEISILKETISKITEEMNKQNLNGSLVKEQIFKLERTVIESKDLLTTVNNKLEQFISESNNRFNDYEYAIAELEKNIPVSMDNENTNDDNEHTNDNDNENDNENDNDHSNETEKSSILSFDLKNIIKQELASVSN